MKINCVIVDDEPENLKYLQQIVEDIDGVEIVKSFTDGASFIAGIKDLKFEMCIMDNRLPDTTGLDLAKRLKNIKVIFVSAHEVSAYDAFDVQAIDVLKKPVTKERLEQAIRKCRNKIINEKGYVFFKTAEGRTRFKFEDIIYIQSDEHTASKFIITKSDDDIKTLKMSLSDMLLKLPGDAFCQISKSIILNTRYFKTFGKDDLVYIELKDKKGKAKSFYVGDTYLPSFKKIIGVEMD